MKVKIAFFFIILFSTLIIAPTVISFVDDTQDVAFFLDLNEEEENKGKEAAKDLEIKIYSTEHSLTFIQNGIQKKKNIRFLSKNYTSLYPKNTTPPPKLLS